MIATQGYEYSEIVETNQVNGFTYQIIRTDDTFSGLLFDSEMKFHTETQRVNLYAIRNRNAEKAIKAVKAFAENTLKQHVEFGMIN